jgi:cytochrome c-type biogenesis protein CcmF
MIGIFVLSFSLPSLILLGLRYKKIPTITQEEAIHSREFWMFIGSLLFFLSAVFIILITSIPVYGKTPLLKSLILKLHGGPLAMPEDAEFLYNKVMILAAIVILMITAVGQYFKYKETQSVFIRQKLIFPTIIAISITLVLYFVYPFTYVKHGYGFLTAIYLAFFAAVYSAIANLSYIFLLLKSNWKYAGGAIAHAGFAIMIAGMLISSSNKKVLSDAKANGIMLPASQDPMTKKTDNPTENLTLIRSVPVKLGNYSAVYQSDSAGNEKGRKFYRLQFSVADSAKSKDNFTLQPDVYVMKDNNMSSNPDTRSYFNKDIFTYLSFVSNPDKEEDTASFREHLVKTGDTIFYKNGYMQLDSVLQVNKSEYPRIVLNDGDVSLKAYFTLTDRQGLHYKAIPVIKANNNGVTYIDDTVYAQNMYVRFNGVSDERKVRIGIKESDQLIDFITIKCYEFPWIGLVWLGLIMLTLGMLMSMSQRIGLSLKLRATLLLLVTTGLVYMFLWPH